MAVRADGSEATKVDRWEDDPEFAGPGGTGKSRAKLDSGEALHHGPQKVTGVFYTDPATSGKDWTAALADQTPDL